MQENCVFLLLLCTLSFVLSSGQSDTLKPGDNLLNNQTLVSAKGVVQMGFFAPSGDGYNYLGIWFVKDMFKKPVWVANRDNPLLSPSGNLTIDASGNLVMTDAQFTKIVLNNDKPASSNKTVARLLDSGNFVLVQGEEMIWQSFDNPTDTFLPGMRLGWLMPQVKLHLATWFSPSVPTTGPYTIGIDTATHSQLGVWHRGILQRTIGYYDGKKFNFLITNSVNDQNFTFSTNSTDVLLSFETIGIYSAVWYSFAANGDINEYKLTDTELLMTKYPLCDSNATKDCVDTVSSNCKEGDEFMLKKGKMRNSKTLLLGPSDCEIVCKSNCSCTAYASLSNGCQLYFGDTATLQSVIAAGTDTIYTRGGSHSGSADNLWWIIAIVVTMSLIFIVLGYLVWRKFMVKDNVRLISFRSSTTNNPVGVNSLDLRGDNDQDMPLINFSSIVSATENFSEENKLGEGGFGAVYKGKLSGHEIAVKRLSKCSKQGVEEFKTEFQLISKLQHRNLVKLLGCCIHDEERILIYEYLPNKSLDSFIFDPKSDTTVLDWSQRLNIIRGIAQGLLYLHKYSRLKVIHRDLKASNILLDSDMNPKISDFGMARIFWENESQAKTRRIAGTYGYMSPEYAIRGIFSTKSDVFSFGVILLEIVSGRRNTSFGDSDTSVYLLARAWELWTGDKCAELLDPKIATSCTMKEAKMCIQLGLLCIQDNPEDRPSMSDVIFILSHEEAALPSPKQPALFAHFNFSDGDSSKKNSSRNHVTFTTMEGR